MQGTGQFWDLFGFLRHTYEIFLSFKICCIVFDVYPRSDDFKHKFALLSFVLNVHRFQQILLDLHARGVVCKSGLFCNGRYCCLAKYDDCSACVDCRRSMDSLSMSVLQRPVFHVLVLLCTILLLYIILLLLMKFLFYMYDLKH